MFLFIIIFLVNSISKLNNVAMYYEEQFRIRLKIYFLKRAVGQWDRDPLCKWCTVPLVANLFLKLFLKNICDLFLFLSCIANSYNRIILV